MEVDDPDGDLRRRGRVAGATINDDRLATRYNGLDIITTKRSSLIVLVVVVTPAFWL